MFEDSQILVLAVLAVPTAFLLFATLVSLIKSHRYVGYSPIPDNDEEDSHRVYKSGRVRWVDVLSAVLCAVTVGGLGSLLGYSVWSGKGDLGVYIGGGVLLVGWVLATSHAIHVARHSTCPPVTYHFAFWFYSLTLLSNVGILFYKMPRIALPAKAYLANVGLLLVLDVYQRYRQDSYGCDVVEGSDRKPWREANATVMSRLFFFWLNPMIYLGKSKPLEENDLWDLMETDRTSSMVSNYYKIKNAHRSRTLFWRLVTLIKGLLGYQLFCAFFASTLALSGPLFLNQIVGWVADPERDIRVGWALLMGMFLSAMVKALMNGQMYLTGRRASLRIRSVVVEEIYQKALRRSAGVKPRSATTTSDEPDKDDASLGKVVTLMSVDAERLREFVAYAHRLTLETPVMAVLVMSALFYTIGWSALVGLLVMALGGPLGGIVGKQIGIIQEQLMSATDKRVNVANEVLQGIRIIKYFSWEPQFIKRVMEARKVEIEKLRKMMYAYLGFHIIAGFSSLSVAFVTFTTYTVVAGESLNPQTAFTAIALLNDLSMIMTFLPYQIMEITQLKVSYDRIANFLAEPELEKYGAGGSESGDDSDIETVADVPVVGFVAGSFKYLTGDDEKKKDDANDDGDSAVKVDVVEGKEEEKAEQDKPTDRPPEFMLRDLNVEFPIGGLSVVCGPTGSGKSSMILALLGELKRVAGHQYLPDPRNVTIDPATGLSSGVAYVAQTPWLINATIRDNILFGCPYDADRYQKVIEACALLRDLETLPGGDLTEIGEKGVNVSGGQKARISLARAAYSRASYILLDDVIAAVDAPTARHLVRECILGWMRDRTRILVSHAVGLVVPHAEFVVCLKGGAVAAQGTPSEVVQNEASDALFGMNLEANVEEKKDIEETGSEEAPKSVAAAKLGEGTKLVDQEERATGSVKASVYWAYIRAAGGVPFIIIFILSFLFVNSAQLAVDWWLKRWTDAQSQPVEMSAYVTHTPGFVALGCWGESLGSLFSLFTMAFSRPSPLVVYDVPETPGNPNIPTPIPPSPDHGTYYYVTVYGLLGILVVFSQVAQNLYIMLKALGATAQLHALLLKKILGAPLRFFETTPVGRILNRFSKDVKSVDSDIVWSIESFVQQVFRGVYILGLITFVNPSFIGAVIPLGEFLFAECALKSPSLTTPPTVWLYLYIAKMYLNTSRELKRLESVSRSPLYSQFSETLAGATTIRAFGAEERLLGQQRDKVDANHRAYFLLWVANRWLCLRTDVIGAVVCLATGIAIVTGDVSPGWAGLALSYALSFADSLLWTIRMHAEMEMSMNSVERVLEYAAVEQEPPAIVDDNRPPSNWPSTGHVQVRDLTIKYAADQPAVLHSLNFSVESGHKVGVVGRTGAGKSTLSLAFFRILPYAAGTILVDGIDIEKLGVRDVRSRFTIIPQDPVLFSGTLRSNLDPFGECSDEKLWEALERVHVLETLTHSSESETESPSPSPDTSSSSPVTAILDLPVTENGSNFSQGQRQLLCLARALLRQTKIIFLDEATASVDNETDAKIQRTMRECFGTATVLCIAHRLRTVMDYDRILVLDKGQVVEFGSPLELALKEGDGAFFRGMVEESGEASELVEIARRVEQGKN
ncbi:hypothetical protein SpCBS45565_g08389 [Spizellomyces sp. 'palustris']|nr:hypothetical protein SpCBS45565_g08389 [Spizellomyces sp. 'palustris']